MTTIRRFEDLHIWQAARELVQIVYRHTTQGGFERDFALRDQIRRAVISIMSNIAEGFGAGSDAEFLRFLGYARRSLSETQSQLYIALDLGYITKNDFDITYQKANTAEKQINAFIAYLAKSKSPKTLKEEPPSYKSTGDLSDLSDQSDH
jgi:four helix bundle protein